MTFIQSIYSDNRAYSLSHMTWTTIIPQCETLQEFITESCRTISPKQVAFLLFVELCAIIFCLWLWDFEDALLDCVNIIICRSRVFIALCVACFCGVYGVWVCVIRVVWVYMMCVGWCGVGGYIYMPCGIGVSERRGQVCFSLSECQGEFFFSPNLRLVLEVLFQIQI